jgi:hypothetical protein
LWIADLIDDLIDDLADGLSDEGEEHVQADSLRLESKQAKEKAVQMQRKLQSHASRVD